MTKKLASFGAAVLVAGIIIYPRPVLFLALAFCIFILLVSEEEEPKKK